MADVVLKETAVVRVGSARVGSGNYWEREVALPDGTTITAMSARVAVGDEVVYLAVGSEMVVDGERYRVTEIDKAPGQLGRVLLDRVPTPS